MKKQILYLALLSMLFTPACKKGSCIRGVVLDAKTGGPGIRRFLRLKARKVIAGMSP